MRAIMLKASPDSYGLIAKLFHWVLALVILWQLFTGINLNQMEPSVEKGQFIWFHQITGTFLFCGIALRLLWKFYNRPVFEDSLPKRHRVVSKILQSLLYLICLWLPLQG
jgi:cytochrome b561